MKKFLYFIIILILFIFTLDKVQALTVYSPVKNTYYQRSQHTYSWHDLEGIQHRLFAPAIYILYKNHDDAINESDWDFDSKYERPWTVDNDDYFLTLCADLIYDFWPVKNYNVVSLASSTYLKDDIKANLNGIIRHSYPFISENDMIKELVDKKVLVETNNKNGEKIYTASKNVLEHKDELEYNINKDELLSAVQMAVYYYTDRDKVDEVYYSTVGVLSTNFSVLDRSAVYSVSDTYEIVKNNIEAIYNYLITLSDNNYYQPVNIDSFVINSKNEIIVKLNNVSNIDNLKLTINKKEKLLKELNVKDLKKDLSGNYIITLDNNEDLEDISIILNGTVYENAEVLVFEAEDGLDVSQTLIGMSKTDIPITSQANKESFYYKDGDVKIEKNTNKDVVSAGDTFTYTIKVKNTTNNTLKDVLITDEIDANLEIIKTDGTINNNQIAWLVNLNPEEEKTFLVEIKVKDNTKDMEISNTANVNIYNTKEEASAKISVIKNPKTNSSIISISTLSIITLFLISSLIILRKKKLYKI